MSDSLPVVELRRSVSLLATEWWLPVGGLAGYLLFGSWVVATGLAAQSVAPELLSRTVTTLGTTPVTGLLVFAALVWLLVPAVVAAWLLERQLSNGYGNLVAQYRLDNPGVLPAPSGAVMLVAGLVAVVVGPRPPVILVLLVASVHLLVRTIAFGRRVYSFSVPPLFSVFAGLSAGTLAAGWLVQAPTLPERVGEQVTRAGVGTVVESGLGAAGTTPETALGFLVAVPALLSGAYLSVQLVVGHQVRSKAPIAQPDKRAEQRYPIMPPVADSSRPGPPSRRVDDDSSAEGSSETATFGRSPAETEAKLQAAENGSAADGDTDEGTPAEQTADDESADDGSNEKESSQTQVFTTDEHITEGDDVVTTAEEADDDDGWIDDTAVFSPERGTSGSDECGACGESIPRESVTFCPNCGEQLRS